VILRGIRSRGNSPAFRTFQLLGIERNLHFLRVVLSVDATKMMTIMMSIKPNCSDILVTNTLEISIPQSAVWLLRLAVNPTLSQTLQEDPMAFAAWYASVGSVIDWPEPVSRIQESERAKRLSLERMMKLLSQVNYTFSGRTSAGHAGRLCSP
jgi:hypothetical protein